MADIVSYVAPSVLMDENASEGWMFLDFEDDGVVLTMTPEAFEATYRPDPDDQG